MDLPRQLLEYDGKPLLRHAEEGALASRRRRVIAVLGANPATLAPALDGLPVTVAKNSRRAEGMGTSIRAGVEAALRENADGVILTLADQPLITPEILDRLVATHIESEQPIVASKYAGTVGVPVLFAREYFDELFGLQPSQGCGGVILKHAASAAHVECPEAESDIDTPEDYLKLGPFARE